MPKVVFSTALRSVVGNTRLSRDGVDVEVSRLKEQLGGDVAVGGAGLAGACMKLDLIDEWRLFVSPVLLGGGLEGRYGADRVRAGDVSAGERDWWPAPG